MDDANVARLQRLYAAAAHFRFADGSDCYEFELSCDGSDGGVKYLAGATLWEARGCKRGPGVQWLETKEAALGAIGK
jgi:hypothetical protein